MSEFHSFLGMNNILLSVYTKFGFSTHPLMDIWLIFYLLAMSNVIINIDGQISVWISSFTFLGKQSEVKLLDLMANLSLIFEDPSYYFCRGGTTFTFPPSVSVQEFQFLHIFTNICQFPLIF